MVRDRLRAFVSYATEDGTVLRDELCSRLHQHAPYIEPWHDGRQAGGYPFEPLLAQKIATSEVLLFVLTEGARSSRWCRWEAELANGRDLPVLVLRFHDTDPLPALSERVRIDFLERGDAAWVQLLDELSRMASPEALLESYGRQLVVLERRTAGVLPAQVRHRYDQRIADLYELQRLQQARLDGHELNS